MTPHAHIAFCYIASWRSARLLLEKHIKYTAADAVVFASDSPCYSKRATWTLTFFRHSWLLWVRRAFAGHSSLVWVTHAMAFCTTLGRYGYSRCVVTGAPVNTLSDPFSDKVLLVAHSPYLDKFLRKWMALARCGTHLTVYRSQRWAV